MTEWIISRILMILFIPILILWIITLFKKYKKQKLYSIGNLKLRPLFLGLLTIIIFISGIIMVIISDKNNQSNIDNTHSIAPYKET